MTQARAEDSESSLNWMSAELGEREPDDVGNVTKHSNGGHFSSHFEFSCILNVVILTMNTNIFVNKVFN